MKTRTADNANSAAGLRPAAPSSIWGDFLRKLCKNKTAVAGFIVFVSVCAACALAPYLTKWDYHTLDTENVFAPPSREHLLGTEYLGRDILARLLYGGRVTLRITLVSTSLAAVIGCLIGLAAGYFRGRADFFISHLLDILASIPVFLLIIVTETAFGWGRGNFMYAMAVAAVPQFARLVRASVMNIISCTYIEAARALGVRHSKIILRHILHNIAPPLIIRFTSGVAEALIICTIMGYLGVGINPPTPEWGALAFVSKSYMRSHPLLIILSSAVIAVCVISVNLFGDGLRDALDPRGT
ncbi:MAG: ABC transporter permease [Oscillospiraceae bacterium]|jgi:peptide/nickel transport system permease protein|nr:ABC transporter permease [Oscillospiraceae bacterium]